MSTENSTDGTPVLNDWQRILVADEPIATPAPPEVAEGQLACALCYRPFAPQELSVASKERFNWESSIVVCQECLTELKLEMRARSSGPDLLLGLVWAVTGFVLTAGLFSLAIWAVRTDTNYNFWQWIGCYFAFVPAFVIGRMIRFGVGKRHSLEQQLIAIFFTVGAILVTAYVGFLADTNNFANALTRSYDQPIKFMSPTLFITNRFVPALTDYASLQNIIPRLGIDFGILLGLVVAYFSSEGSRIYSRPYLHKQNTKV